MEIVRKIYEKDVDNDGITHLECTHSKRSEKARKGLYGVWIEQGIYPKGDERNSMIWVSEENIQSLANGLISAYTLISDDKFKRRREMRAHAE